jgi:hypothetical protein
MKQGSTDDPFADDPERAETPAADPDADSPSRRTGRTDSAEPDTTQDDGSPAIPYIYMRDAVKEGRNQRPVYLRECNEDRIPELVDAVEDLLGEDVTKTDVLEAAMETAIENPDLVAETLRTERYGYDWE